MDWISKVFSGAVDWTRVNPVGLVLMAAGIVLALLRNPRLSSGQVLALRLSGLLVCAGGALLAILG